MSKTLSTAEINHLRRLIGWMDCEVGPSPDEMVDTMKKIAPTTGHVSDEGRQRMIESMEKAASVPLYVRAAIKALRKATADQSGQVVDAEISQAARAVLPRQSLSGGCAS